MAETWGYSVPLTSTALAKMEGDIHAEALFKRTFDDDVSTVASTCKAENMPCWTKRSVLALCHELLTGFSAPDFQEELQKLRAKAPNDMQVAGRMELALTAQKKIIPKYGFPATAEGVEAMRDAICPYLMDYMVKMVVDDIDRKLGLPPNSTAKAAKGPQTARFESERERSLSDESVMTNSSTDSENKERSVSEVSVTPSSTPIVDKDTEFSRQQVLSLCNDLLQGFSNAEFQEALQPILERSKGRKAVPERTLLALKVQGKVLPKYGLPGNMAGVLLMLDKIAPHAGDWMVMSLVNSIDEKLGLPANTTISSLPPPA